MQGAVSVAALALLGGGCDRGAGPPPAAAAPSCPEAPACVCPECPPPPPPPALGLGKLDRVFLERALAIPSHEKIEVKVGLDGSIEEVELYHGDAAAIPEAVRELAARTFPGAKVKKFETELDAAGEIFEVEVEVKGRECEVSARADGTLIYTECELPAKAITPEIRAVVAKVLPGAKIEGIKEITRGEVRSIEVEAELGGHEHELLLNDGLNLVRHVRKVPAVLEVVVH